MSLCILAAGKVTSLAVSLFTLSWTHSVQKTEWRESWEATPAGLELRQASIKGSGAGMEPGTDAILRDGWWIWKPKLPPQPRLALAASGAIVGGWRLCHEGGCMELGTTAGEEIILNSCP
ncbi:DUF1850 domain-containing protein [Rhizobium sp. LC145]|uniref:DUF1850 domain-containing protein n=1 Tax=Rhizobium sp. LC145 TaxID=1120688 RepID=UPI000629F65E|nr:DUF1850 domain-containing protein [Rhizobium sp. LC145]KKX28326.1 hypothetical protein YH62_19855 [Rhizobium sp. LC145]TKT58247.1 DUF1850 domain-containing protein [Rhizobiaceae bacterium LC148]